MVTNTCGIGYSPAHAVMNLLMGHISAVAAINMYTYVVELLSKTRQKGLDKLYPVGCAMKQSRRKVTLRFGMTTTTNKMTT